MNTTLFFLLNKNRMKSVYNVPLVRTQSTTALANIGQLLDVQITGVQNNDILVYEAPKWKNKPQVLNNNNDVTITNPVNNEFLGYNGTEWINKEIALNDLSDVALTSLSVNQILQWDGDYWSNYNLPTQSFANLSDVQITIVQNNDNIIYNSATSKYINKKKYAEYDNIVQLSNQTITGVARTIYFCNLAVINLPPSTIGECIKIINALGTNCTFAYTGIIYHLVNNFNTSYTTTVSAEIELEGILGGNWQIKSFTGRWNNNNTNRRLVNNNLEDLLNTNIVLPLNGHYLRFDGTNWVNTPFPTMQIFLHSNSNLTNGGFITAYGTNTLYGSSYISPSRTMRITSMLIYLQIVITGVAVREFRFFLNGIDTGVIVSMNSASGNFVKKYMNIVCNLGDTFAIRHNVVGATVNTPASCTLEYI